jgi:hypothetical protein
MASKTQEARARKKGETRGIKPLYGKRMERIFRVPMTEGHWAALSLAATITGRSRSQLTRDALERYTAEILTPTKTNAARDESRGAQKSNALDHDSS